MKRPASLILAFLSAMPLFAAEPLIIGHRGASGVAPENTVAAFKEAFAQKADGFELDIWLTKDGRAVALHDKTAKRTTGADLVPAEHDMAEFKKLEAGSWKHEKYKGEPVPDLTDSLSVLAAGKTVYIEIKCGPEILPEVKRVVEASGKSKDQIVLISFDYETLVEARSIFPGYKILWIVGGKTDKATNKKVYPEISGLIEKAKAAGFEGLDLHYGFPLDKETVIKIKEQGLELAVWTVNDPAIGKQLAEAGVDAITTDEPALIRAGLEPE